MSVLQHTTGFTDHLIQHNRPGDGLLHGLGTHSLDQTLLLFGPPSTIWATTRALKPNSKAIDTFIINLQYSGNQSNLLVTVRTSIVNPIPMHKIPKYAIRGRHGAFFKTGEDCQVDQFYAGVDVKDERFGVEPEEYWGYLCTTEESRNGKFEGAWKSEKGSYRDYYVDVVKAIRGEKEVVVKPEESRMGLRVIELTLESVRTGRSVEFTE